MFYIRRCLQDPYISWHFCNFAFSVSSQLQHQTLPECYPVAGPNKWHNQKNTELLLDVNLDGGLGCRLQRKPWPTSKGSSQNCESTNSLQGQSARSCTWKSKCDDNFFHEQPLGPGPEVSDDIPVLPKSWKGSLFINWFQRLDFLSRIWLPSSKIGNQIGSLSM